MTLALKKWKKRLSLSSCLSRGWDCLLKPTAQSYSTASFAEKERKAVQATLTLALQNASIFLPIFVPTGTACSNSLYLLNHIWLQTLQWEKEYLSLWHIRCKKPIPRSFFWSWSPAGLPAQARKFFVCQYIVSQKVYWGLSVDCQFWVKIRSVTTAFTASEFQLSHRDLRRLESEEPWGLQSGLGLMQDPAFVTSISVFPSVASAIMGIGVFFLTETLTRWNKYKFTSTAWYVAP